MNGGSERRPYAPEGVKAFAHAFRRVRREVRPELTSQCAEFDETLVQQQIRFSIVQLVGRYRRGSPRVICGVARLERKKASSSRALGRCKSTRE